ncbi:AraC family transcriptional regulator [Niastella koreensis]|uniref:Transcriptional regulator, AraC family n=2 Tax=Niastella koreensis TaxID=354356 RepID=G8TAW0_NIAKG|nr:helix-turn-helix domain-containing protein [Niastella koreensis]AEW00303.1 transcriptional regulator, AraC family [Niastella koreensis GR20-10]OQP52171.1 AraC family transcriptional regulator [Niastella koreensis]
MRSKNKHIPVNTLPQGVGEGIIIARSELHGSPNNREVERSHRDGGHSFILQEKGITHLEIDFLKYKLKAPALLYMHPNQVHRVIGFDKATISSWIITSENLHPELLHLLEDLTPVTPLTLDKETYTILAETAALCLQFAERKQEKLYHQILQQSCNTLVALVASQYEAQLKPVQNLNRFEVITKAFRSLLEQNFTTVKSPMDYARQLNVSKQYLNECVKTTTGFSVSWHIQQRIVLEAKRLLYHSDKSVKEIASALGYEDHSYFGRFFAKVSGMTPLAFRSKNLV